MIGDGQRITTERAVGSKPLRVRVFSSSTLQTLLISSWNCGVAKQQCDLREWLTSDWGLIFFG